jgi:hypothetical protein
MRPRIPAEIRRAAIKAGLTTYYTGQLCKRGHRARRHVSNSNCSECVRLLRRTVWTNDKTYRVSPKGRESSRRYAQTPRGQEAYRAYNVSPKGRERARTYNASAKGKARWRADYTRRRIIARAERAVNK